MEARSRLFNCGWCHKRVSICIHCDNGNVYCGSSCSKIARQRSVKSAGKKYQSTRQGKFKHAERQRRYRENKKQLNFVTHHPCDNKDFCDEVVIQNMVTPVAEQNTICYFCGK